MRLLPYLPAVGAAVWMAAITITMLQTPSLALATTEACRAPAERWADHLTREGFSVELSVTPEANGSCLTARLGGYRVDGAVDPAALSKLLMKKPRGVVGLSQESGAPVMAVLADGGVLPFQTILEKEKKQ